MADITRKYNINTLRRVRINNNNTETIGYHSDSGKTFIEVKNTAHYTEFLAKRYNPTEITMIETLDNMIYRNGLDVLLLDANGNVNLEIDREKIFILFGITKDIESIDEKQRERFDTIASEAARICSEKLNIPESNKFDFELLLKSFIFIELMQSRIMNNKVTITKFDNYVDYKINRIIKFLKINLDLNSIDDFKLEYDCESLSADNVEVLDFKEKPKTKTIIHVR